MTQRMTAPGDGPPIRGIRQALRTLTLSAPLHPILVHFSIALTSASFAFDIGSRLFGLASLADAGWWALAASALATAGTVASGVVSRMGIPVEEGEARSYLRAHMVIGPIFFGLLLAVTTWRADLWTDQALPTSWYLGALGAVIVLMTIQGFVGGELVYRFGMDVRGHYRSLPVMERGAPPRRSGARS